MNKNANILLLVGSPKSASSTSNSLGDYLISHLEQLGLSVDKEYIYKLVRKEEGQKKLLTKVEEADMIILAFPLYIDCLPAGVIEALELIADRRKSKKDRKKQRFAIIINCGFPETQHNNTAIAICKFFAREVGFEWKGALSLGMGGAIGGRSLEERGGMVRNVIKGLNLSAQALAEGKDIPEEATELFGKKFIPISLYTKVGNMGWNRQAKKYGVRKKIEDQPYL
jgi:hypothetical protein